MTNAEFELSVQREVNRLVRDAETQYKLECALGVFEEVMLVLDKDSMEYAQCFDSANDLREILGKQRVEE